MARLRNRIRKADYFTDGELLRWHRDKRQTYTGLWAMAEDSGCLEDDPFAWKLLIWGSPLDADITVQVLEKWRDELIDAGKLIPYEADGKRYLFIRTFHQHEQPRNPGPPDLPLPEWLELVTMKGVGKDGKEWVRHRYVDHKYTVQNRHGLCTDSVQTPLPRPALSRVPKGTQGQDDGENGCEDKSSSSPVLDKDTCWRCHQPIDPDDLIDDRCVLSRKGLRHEVCP